MLQLLVLVLIGWAGWAFWRSRRSEGGLEKCRGCRFNRRSDDDGTLCDLGNKEVFKNRIQVSWCQNWQRR